MPHTSSSERSTKTRKDTSAAGRPEAGRGTSPPCVVALVYAPLLDRSTYTPACPHAGSHSSQKHLHEIYNPVRLDNVPPHKTGMHQVEADQMLKSSSCKNCYLKLDRSMSALLAGTWAI